MSFLNKIHIEKILLLLSSLAFLGLFLFSSPRFLPKQTLSKTKNTFLSRVKLNNENYYKLSIPTSLMPGDSIFYKRAEDDNFSSFQIISTYYVRGVDLKIFCEGNVYTGELRKSFSMDTDWKSSREPVILKTSKGNENIVTADIDSIAGVASVLPSGDLSEMVQDGTIWSIYQRTLSQDNHFSIKDRVKWTETKTEENASKYDLFTPPIIYIHEGKLSTRIPSKEKAKEDIEPFGLEMVSSVKTPYPLLLVGWVGEVPYFQLLEDDSGGLGGRILRNRVVPQTKYKRALDPKPGQSKLVPCDSNDTDAWFIVQNFEVLQYKNAKTGGVKPVGIATVQDFISKRPPFKINSLNTDAPAGDYQFNFLVKLPGLPSENLSFSSINIGKTFTFSGRDYEISQIDLDLRKVLITKKDPRVADNITRTFSF
jgi:hypothetical protein